MQVRPACFLSLSDCNGGDGDRHEETNIFYNNFNSIQNTMKRKDYQRPTMKVVQLQHQTHLLAGSGVEANRSGYGTAEEEEWE